MTKAPEAGKVKTRLTPPLTLGRSCAAKYLFSSRPGAFDLGGLQTSQARGVGIYTPLGAEAAYENILPRDFFLLPQRGNDFGQRLIFAAEDLLAVGFESVCLINSDSPTIPASSFMRSG